MRSISGILLVLNVLMLNCGPNIGRSDRSWLMETKGPVKCEGPDFVAFKTDTVWVFILRSDTASVHHLSSLLLEGVLRGEWLLGYGDMHFRRPTFELTPEQWQSVTCQDSLDRTDPIRRHSAFIWKTNVVADSAGSHYYFSVFPEPSSANLEFRLDIPTNDDLISLKCISYQI